MEESQSQPETGYPTLYPRYGEINPMTFRMKANWNLEPMAGLAVRGLRRLIQGNPPRISDAGIAIESRKCVEGESVSARRHGSIF